MPYKSAKQRKYLNAKHPEIAKKWNMEERFQKMKKKPKKRKKVARNR